MKKILVLAAAGLVAIAGAVPTIASAAETAPQATAVYYYDPIDASQGPSWANAGPQTLLYAVEGWHGVGADLSGVPCGKYIQIDFLTGLAVSEVPVSVSHSSPLPKGSLHRSTHSKAPSCEVVVPPVVEPPVETPTPPVEEAPPAGPVTPESPKDLTALSDDERAGVEQFADAHGIAPEEVLVEMG